MKMAKATCFNMNSLDDLHEIRLLLSAFDNSTVEFPLHVWWFATGKHWVVNTGRNETHRRWCRLDGRLVDFDKVYGGPVTKRRN